MNTRSFQILIVDDVPKNIQLAANILKDAGYQMAFAQSGLSALSLIHDHQFDLILLDVMMPEMNGFEVCEILKKNEKFRDIPIIFLTAKIDMQSIVRGFELGAVDYITKPFKGAELLARVRNHLELYFSKKKIEEINAKLQEEISRRKTNEERFRYLAIHDSLTGLFNTRHLYRALPNLIASTKTNSTVFSLIFVDIDNFKVVVDTHGHLNGSKALAEVADTIRSVISEPAYAVAYGGDEFVIVLPGSGKKRAMEKAEEIREAMSRTPYLAERGLIVRLRASFGVSTYPEDAEDMSKLLAVADQAMFEIKEKGKDGIGALTQCN